MKIKLIADSTCDLSENLIQKYDIRIIPLTITMGAEVLKDGVDVTAADIFNYTESGKGLCRTSAANTAEYAEAYGEELPRCDAILHFIVSSDMSACYQNALIAAADYDNVYLVDSRNLSTAIGHLVLDAAEMAGKGMSAADIHGEITRRVPLLDAGFIIDSLTYLHKGGRCTALQALMSSVLKIRPCIAVSEGKMTVGKKYRGSLEHVLRRYVTEKLTDKATIDTRRIFVTHTLTEQNKHLADMVKSLITEILPFDEIYETTAGGTISCHCGPNTLGILFYRKAAAP
jgi:DegV family protein with EDD domain